MDLLGGDDCVEVVRGGRRTRLHRPRTLSEGTPPKDGLGRAEEGLARNTGVVCGTTGTELFGHNPRQTEGSSHGKTWGREDPSTDVGGGGGW